MHHDWQIEHWEVEYVHTHIRVAQLRFRNLELPHYHDVAQVGFRAEVAPVLVAVHMCLCSCSVSPDSLLGHLGMEGNCLYDFLEPLSAVCSITAFTFSSPGNKTALCFSCRTSARGFLIRSCVSSLAARDNPPFAIVAMLKERRMSDCTGCTWPPCLTIIADMLETYKKFVVTNTEIRQLPQPSMTPYPAQWSLQADLFTLGGLYHEICQSKSQHWCHHVVRVCGL